MSGSDARDSNVVDGELLLRAALHKRGPETYDDDNAFLKYTLSDPSAGSQSRRSEETDPTSRSLTRTVNKRSGSNAQAYPHRPRGPSSSISQAVVVNSGPSRSVTADYESSRSDDSSIQHGSIRRMVAGAGGVAEGLQHSPYPAAINESFSFSELFEDLTSSSSRSLNTARRSITIDELERGPEPSISERDSIHHHSSHSPPIPSGRRLSTVQMTMSAFSCLIILVALVVAAYYNLTAIQGPWKVSKIVSVTGCFVAVSFCVIGMYNLDRNLLEITAVALVIIVYMILLAT